MSEKKEYIDRVKFIDKMADIIWSLRCSAHPHGDDVADGMQDVLNYLEDEKPVDIVEVVRKETAKEILDYFDRYVGTGKYLIGNMIRMQREKYGIEVEEL